MHNSHVALVGSPNCGKTSIFNSLTGSNQRVGNFPGVTVEKKQGQFVTKKGSQISLIDLPGIYSLTPQSPDEEVTLNYLKSSRQQTSLIVAVTDSTNLHRGITFALELKELGKPIVLVLNMYDLAVRRKCKIDIGKLSKLLGIPVTTSIATQKKSLENLVDNIVNTIELSDTGSQIEEVQAPSTLLERCQKAAEVVDEVVTEPIQPPSLTHKIDKVILHPTLGVLILSCIVFTIFQAVFSWAEVPMNLIENGITIMGDWLTRILPSPSLKSLLVDGILGGVGAVMTFLPQIIILFTFIFILEGSGYMMRAAFITDRFMNLVGLRGRSFVPLLSSFACAIPGMMATRTIRDPKERLITILVAPLMTCSARLPVYVLLVGAFIPNTSIAGIFNLQGLVMFALFLAGIASAMIMSWAMGQTLMKGEPAPMVMELPTYKMPRPSQIMRSLWVRVKAFLTRAGKVIMGVAVVIWFLCSYPNANPSLKESPIEQSYAGQIGKTIQPVFAPLGFDWRISTGIIPGFAAREVMVGVLGTLFAIEGADETEKGSKSLGERVSKSWPLGTGLALLVWYIFAPQCLATFAVMRRETNSLKWPIFGFCYMLAAAYTFAFLTNQLTSLLVAS